MANRARQSGISAKGVMDAILDEIDEARAKRVRHDFGLQRWILSWQPSGKGSWVARLSDLDDGPTIERTGRTRAEAIEKAARAMRGPGRKS